MRLTPVVSPRSRWVGVARHAGWHRLGAFWSRRLTLFRLRITSLLLLAFLAYLAWLAVHEDDRLLQLILAAPLAFWAGRALARWLRVARHRRRVRWLEAFARGLRVGSLDALGIYEGGVAMIRGELDGRPVSLRVRTGPRPALVYGLTVIDAVAELELSAPGLAARLLPGEDAVELPVTPVTPGSLGPGFQREALEEAVRALFRTRGVRRIRLTGGRLVAERGFRERALQPAALRSLFRELARIGRMCERKEITVQGRSEPHFAWSGHGGGLRCPYCHDDLHRASLELSACRRCRTLQHSECFAEAGGCSIFGCAGAAEELLARSQLGGKPAAVDALEAVGASSEPVRLRS